MTMTDKPSTNQLTPSLECEPDGLPTLKCETDASSSLKCEPDVSPTTWNKIWESLQSPWTEDQAKKRKRGLYSLGFKLQVLAEVDEKKLIKSEICRKYGIPNSTLSGFLATRDQIETAVNDSQFSLNKKIVKRSRHENIERILYKWYSEAHAMNMPISGPILMEKAAQISKQMGISFTPTIGWLKGFKRRKGLHYCAATKTWLDGNAWDFSFQEHEISNGTSKTHEYLQNITDEEHECDENSNETEAALHSQRTAAPTALDLTTVHEHQADINSSTSDAGDVQMVTDDKERVQMQILASDTRGPMSSFTPLNALVLTVNEHQNGKRVAPQNISTFTSLKKLAQVEESCLKQKAKSSGTKSNYSAAQSNSKPSSLDIQNPLSHNPHIPTIGKTKEALTVLRRFLESNDGSEQHLQELSSISGFIEKCSENYHHKSLEALAVLRQFLEGQSGSEKQMRELSSIYEFVDKSVGKYHQTSIKDFFK